VDPRPPITCFSGTANPPTVPLRGHSDTSQPNNSVFLQSTPVFSCYEAGRDGFWLHRFLHHYDINNVIVDSSSIEVNRRLRRAKADSLDAASLVGLLMRYRDGETNVWSTVTVPDL
jgi:transposase